MDTDIVENAFKQTLRPQVKYDHLSISLSLSFVFSNRPILKRNYILFNQFKDISIVESILTIFYSVQID